MPETYEVLTTPRAIEMLTDHVEFLANVSESAALKLIDDFGEQALTLEELPNRYPWISFEGFPAGKYRKLHFSKYYLALYLVKGQKVYIHYVIDTRQDYQWLIDAKL